jgi:undecaprenyl-phosphate 4-deoxy-4-formamido-L-arabinose transferase
MVAVLVLAGVQLVVVGLIGEYLGRMFLAVNRKPQYLVREVFRRGPAGLEVERPKVDTRAAGQPHREPSQGES